MYWTHEKPTQAGWYWYQEQERDHAGAASPVLVVQVWEDGGELVTDAGYTIPATVAAWPFAARWAGPLPEPTP